MTPTDLDWDVLILTGRLSGEDVGDLRVGRGLPTDGTLDGTSPWANTVLLHNDGNALITEAVAARQHCPLETRRNRIMIITNDPCDFIYKW